MTGAKNKKGHRKILQYVQAHHRITRRDVVELCRVTERQANYLLQKLTERGQLVRTRKGRATAYERP